MSRKKDSVEKSFSDLRGGEQHIAAAMGRKGLETMRSGVFMVAQWMCAMAECKARHPSLAYRERKELVKIFGDYEFQLENLLDEAATKKDGQKLRLLADAIELLRTAMPLDPLRSLMLALKANGAKPMSDTEIQSYIRKTSPNKVPSLKTIQRVRAELNAPRNKRGPKPGTKQKSILRLLK